MKKQGIPIYIDIDRLNDSLLNACKSGNFEKVKYFLTSDELSQHADIYSKSNHPLLFACLNNHTDIIDYLLYSPELKHHADIHANEDIIFHYLLECRQNDVLKYLIFDLNIEKNKRIERCLKIFPNQDVENWFKVRDWDKEVTQGLDINKSVTPNNNIKKTKI